MPELQVEQIHTLTVVNRYGRLTLHKRNQSWYIEEKEDYQADTVRMNEILSTLSELSIEQKTIVAQDRWDQMGVSDPTATESGTSGCKIELHGEGGYHRSLIVGDLQASGSEAALMFGNEFDGRSFLRRSESDEVYLVSQSLSFFNTIPSHWMLNILSNPHAYRRILYVKDGELQWTLERASRSEAYQLLDSNHGRNMYLPKLTVSIDYAFSSMFIRDVLPTGFAANTVGIAPEHYFELEALDGFTQRIYLGGKVKAPEQEQQNPEGQTGVFRKVRSDIYRYAMLDWEMERNSPPNDEPPYLGRTYLIDSPQMDDLMLSYQEMLVYERMNPAPSR